MESFDVVILGGGAGAKMIWGSVQGRSVLVIEEHRVGGDCPFVACVPSKAMLRSAHVWQTAAEEQWTPLFGGRVSAAAAYEQAVRRRDRIVHDRDDSANAAGLEKSGATLLRGRGRVARPGVVEVAGVEVGYGELVLNTGSEPVRPDVPGLDSVPVWTSDEALSTSSYPASVLVLGGGPVGCELAFLLASFGSRVVLVQRADRLVPREEPEASAAVLEAISARGVAVRLDTQLHAATPGPRGGGRFTLVTGEVVDAELLVLAAGRRSRSTSLGLDRLGIAVASGAAIPTDDHCRVPGAQHVWAVGDVTGVAPFTHTAHYQGRIVAANLAGRYVSADYRAIPRGVYIDPVVAAVGHTVATARAAGLDPVMAGAPMTQAVRSATEGEADGWLHVLADPTSGALLGATGLGGHAEEWISEVSLAIRAGIPVEVAAGVVHPFPTYSEVLETPLWELAARMHRETG